MRPAQPEHAHTQPVQQMHHVDVAFQQISALNGQHCAKLSRLLRCEQIFRAQNLLHFVFMHVHQRVERLQISRTQMPHTAVSIPPARYIRLQRAAEGRKGHHGNPALTHLPDGYAVLLIGQPLFRMHRCQYGIVVCINDQHIRCLLHSFYSAMWSWSFILMTRVLCYYNANTSAPCCKAQVTIRPSMRTFS